MIKESWIFPADGSPPYRRGEEPPRTERKGLPAILPDLPDFVSPIDKKVYSGRAGLREHCKRHDVVPNLELKGLPYLQGNSDMRDPQQVRRDREARKELLIRQVNQHYR
jgi:hypothetical protein